MKDLAGFSGVLLRLTSLPVRPLSMPNVIRAGEIGAARLRGDGDPGTCMWLVKNEDALLGDAKGFCKLDNGLGGGVDGLDIFFGDSEVDSELEAFDFANNFFLSRILSRFSFIAKVSSSSLLCTWRSGSITGCSGGV